jgi:hypothetical protein
VNEEKPGDACRHEFVFLRQERKNVGYDRNPTWLVEDVFFCEGCLLYRRVPVEKRTPRSDSFEERVEKLR